MPHLLDVFIFISENLSPTQLWVVMALAFVFALYLGYRTLGIGAVLGLLIVAFFFYVLYDHDSFKSYKEKERNDASYEQRLREELLKD